MFFTPGYVPTLNTGAKTTPPPPAPVSFAGTLVSTAKAYTTGGASKAAGVAVGAIATKIPVVGQALGVAELFGFNVGDLFSTKSKANWDRTLGRVFRAIVLGYVSGTAEVMRFLKNEWVKAGDTTGAQFWDRLVSVAKFPTEKGGTKEGFGAGAPAGSKTAEASPGFSSNLVAFLNAVG